MKKRKLNEECVAVKQDYAAVQSAANGDFDTFQLQQVVHIVMIKLHFV